MALLGCPECRREVSDRAPACPHCGCPIAGGRGPAPPPAPVHVTHREAGSFGRAYKEEAGRKAAQATPRMMVIMIWVVLLFVFGVIAALKK